MKYKRSMIMLMLAIFIFAAASVSASDVNDTVIAGEDASQMGLSQGSGLDADNLETSEKNTTLAQTNADESVSGEIDSEVIGADTGTYSGLSSEIGPGGNIKLKHGKYTYDFGSTIEISVPNSVIDGNGAVIDMAGSTNMRAFYVRASDVVIKNLTIKNANYEDCGCAVYFFKFGTLINCNVTGNTLTGDAGGSVFFFGEGNVINCTFTGNSAGNGGAAIFMDSGNVANCSFIENTIGNRGGAIWISSSADVSNCKFTKNSALYGGAVYFHGEGNVTNCNFTDNSGYQRGVQFSLIIMVK